MKSKKQKKLATKVPLIPSKIAQENSLGKRFKKIAAPLILFAFAFCLYANTLNHGFVLDDEAVIVQNTIVHKGLKGIPEIITSPYWFGFDGSKDGYRPISLLMFSTEWEFAKDKPFTYHLMNVIWFALSGVILFFALRRLFSATSWIFPFVISLLYIAHPIHTEVVANIKSRDEIMSFFFSAASIFFLAKPGLRKKSIVLSLVCFLLALLSKENSVMLIFVVPLILWQFIQVPRSKIVSITAAFLGVFIIYGAMRFFVQGSALTFRQEIPLSDNALVAANGVVERLATAIYLLGYYIKLMVLPDPLVSDYSMGFTEILSWTSWKPIISLIVIASLLGLAIVKIKKIKYVSFGILFFFITLFLVANIFFLGGAMLAERFLHTPSLGFCILVATFFAGTLQFEISKKPETGEPGSWKKNLVFYITVMILLAFYSILTVQRNADWKSEISLFSKDVNSFPSNVKTNYYFANSLMKKVKKDINIKQTEKDSLLNIATIHLEKSLAIYPDYIDARQELGNVYFAKGDYSRSMQYYERSLINGSPKANHYVNYACAAIELEQYPKADTLLRKALALNPGSYEAHANLGTAYSRQAMYPSALEEYLKAFRISQSEFLLVKNIGGAYGNLQQFDSSLYYFNKAYKINPNDAELNSYLARVYQAKGDAESAAYYSDRAAALSGTSR